MSWNKNGKESRASSKLLRCIPSATTFVCVCCKSDAPNIYQQHDDDPFLYFRLFTGSEIDDEEMVVSESENSNDSWTTEEFSSEFIMRYGSRLIKMTIC